MFVHKPSGYFGSLRNPRRIERNSKSRCDPKGVISRRYVERYLTSTGTKSPASGLSSEEHELGRYASGGFLIPVSLYLMN